MILTERFVALLAAGGLMIGFSGWFRPLAPVGVAIASLAICGAVADLFRLARRTRLEVVRTCDAKLSLGAENTVRLAVRNPSHSPLVGLVRDEYPEGFSASGNVMPLRMPSRCESELSYTVRPANRGDYAFGDIYVRLRGPLAMAVRQIRFPAAQPVKVYPNLLDMRRYEIGLKRRVLQTGHRAVRIYGRGTDFESLREYLRDDEFRAVDWKASARSARLMTRQYQQEKSQNVMLVLDCGRVMGPVVDRLTRLDHAINAAMMLAHVASLKGDKVGLMAFAADVLSYSAPRAGRSQTLNLLSQTYSLQNAHSDSDYYRAFPFLSRKWTRRSLLVVFTDLLDPESSQALISQVAGLTRKHLCLCVAMSDPAVVHAAYASVSTASDTLRAAAARQVLQARKLAAAQLARAGAIVLDIPPGEFTAEVVGRYLDIKSRGLL